MKDKVIAAAGKTWHTLGAHEAVKISDLADLVKANNAIVFQALGWLAREDKIVYSSRGGADYVGLSQPELQAYRRVSGRPAPQACANAAKSRGPKAAKAKK